MDRKHIKMAVLPAVLSLFLMAGCASNLVTQGRRLSTQGEHDRAIELLHQYLVEHPDRLEGWRELGACSVRRSRDHSGGE